MLSSTRLTSKDALEINSNRDLPYWRSPSTNCCSARDRERERGNRIFSKKQDPDTFGAVDSTHLISSSVSAKKKWTRCRRRSPIAIKLSTPGPSLGNDGTRNRRLVYWPLATSSGASFKRIVPSGRLAIWFSNQTSVLSWYKTTNTRLQSDPNHLAVGGHHHFETDVQSK